MPAAAFCARASPGRSRARGGASWCWTAGTRASPTLLGAAGRPDLLAAARAGLGPREFVAQTGTRLAVVRAGQAFRGLAQVSVRDRERLVRALEAVRRESDCVLVDTASDDLVLASGCGELVLLVRPHAEGVLESYRLLKRIAPMIAGRSVLVLVNRARPGVQSMRFFGNLSATARQFLGISLEFAGSIPEDDSLQRASSLKQPVVDVFPGSPAARAVRGCAFGLLGRDNAEALGVEAFVGRLIAAQRAQAR